MSFVVLLEVIETEEHAVPTYRTDPTYTFSTGNLWFFAELAELILRLSGLRRRELWE